MIARLTRMRLPAATAQQMTAARTPSSGTCAPRPLLKHKRYAVVGTHGTLATAEVGAPSRKELKSTQRDAYLRRQLCKRLLRKPHVAEHARRVHDVNVVQNQEQVARRSLWYDGVEAVAELRAHFLQVTGAGFRLVDVHRAQCNATEQHSLSHGVSEDIRQ